MLHVCGERQSSLALVLGKDPLQSPDDLRIACSLAQPQRRQPGEIPAAISYVSRVLSPGSRFNNGE